MDSFHGNAAGFSGRTDLLHALTAFFDDDSARRPVIPAFFHGDVDPFYAPTDLFGR
jgi:hypothetical protein